MDHLPQILGGCGVVCLSSSAYYFNTSGGVTPAVAIGSLVGVGLTLLGFAKNHTEQQRGANTSKRLEAQSKFLGTVEWKQEKDEDGKAIMVRHGKKGILNLALDENAGVKGFKRQTQQDADGLVKSTSPDINTTYDLIFRGTDAYNDKEALGRCVQQHTFKDVTLPDGKPNPKPVVIDVPGKWECLTFKEMKQQARAFGSYLRGVQNLAEREKISIWSNNSVEWVLTDFACAAFNWVSVSVYDTLGPDAASYIVADSGSEVLVCEDKTFKKVPALLEDDVYTSNQGKCLRLVVFLGKGDSDTKAKIEAKGITVIGFKEAVAKGESKIVNDTPPKKDDMVTIMYTSGTTGMPKGVMLLHSNIVATISMIDLNPSITLDGEIHLSYLPLAHIFERQNALGVLSKGGTIYFASLGSKFLLPDLSIIRPTIFAGVPKVYETVRDAVKRKMTGVKAKLFAAAMKAKVADLETGCGYSKLWDKLIFSKTKKALGGRVRFCVTGGAPISKDTLQFVICALAPVVQGYGATETSAASTLTMTFDTKVGNVGPPLGTAAIRLSDVPEMNYFSGEDGEYKKQGGQDKVLSSFAAGKNKSGGEVWIGGPGVSPGYYDPSVNGVESKRGKVPSNGMSKKTEEEFHKEGEWSWFRTGDIGSWTDRGCLKIVDRRKNMYKTSLGEYIPVEEIEKTYQDNCEFVDFVFLPKETKVSYIALCCIVSDSIGSVMKWAQENGVAGDETTVVASPKFRKLLFEQFKKAATDKKLLPFMHLKEANIHAEYQPKDYQEHWVQGVTCASGKKEQLLTATFKARRAQLDQYFAPVFSKIYPDRPADHILP